MKHLFIINPAAGSRDRTKAYTEQIRSICGARGLDYSIKVSAAPGECRRLAQDAARTGEEYRIYACGGDGTLNEVVSGAAGYEHVAVTAFAGGSGNDFVRMFDRPEAFGELEQLLDCEEVRFDLIRCNEDYSLNICSVGLDARIGTDVSRYKRIPLLQGFRAYAASTVVNTIKGIAEHYIIEINGERIDGEKTMVCVCNGQFYGVKNNPEGRYRRNISYQGVDIRSTVLPQYYTYPKGSDLYDYNRQMPIEECADMILISSFYLASGGEEEYIKNEMPLLRQWCEYLISKGLIPENQLCTDDFLKHMDKNVNLAVKATVAIKAFAHLEDKFGGDGSKYHKVAGEWEAEFKKRWDGKPMALSFDDEGGTFSMKYNLAPAKLLKLGVFDEATIQREVQVCLEHNLEFGFPLDNRSNLTKCDWMMWIAAMSDSLDDQKKIIKSAYNYLAGAIDRVPYADLYDCETGVAEEFTNRTVLGSMFMLLLKDKLAKA